MVTRNGIPLRWAVGSGMARPTLAYLATVILGAWVYRAVEDVRQGGDLVRAPIAAAAALVGSGLVVLAFVALLLVPAMVLTIELVHRGGATSRATRSVIGAASWAGWCLFLAVTLAVASRLVAGPETLGGDLLLFAASGAGFSVLAFDGCQTRSGAALIASALVVTALVIVGSIWMAGRWGGAV